LGFRGDQLDFVFQAPPGTEVDGWQIQTVEFYSDGFIVRARRKGFLESNDPDPGDWSVVVDGIRYEVWAAAAASNDERTSAHAEFTPRMNRFPAQLTVEGLRSSAVVRVERPDNAVGF
jgi:hypothetical protein